MKSSTTVLYPNQQVADKVTEYSESRTLALPKEISDYHAWICTTQEDANYSISTFQAKSLVWLARLVKAKRGMPVLVLIPNIRRRGLTFSPQLSKSGATLDSLLQCCPMQWGPRGL